EVVITLQFGDLAAHIEIAQLPANRRHHDEHACRDLYDGHDEVESRQARQLELLKRFIPGHDDAPPVFSHGDLPGYPGRSPDPYAFSRCPRCLHSSGGPSPSW